MCIRDRYDATGVKLQKRVFENGNSTPIEKRDYIRGSEYKDNILEAVYHEEGRFLNTGDNNSNLQWEHQYSLKDHLGNTRIMFADQDDDGTISVNEQLQEHHYYPFGLEQNGEWNIDNSNGESMNYLYNGKEFNGDFGLNLNDYGARFYDPSISLWTSVDPWVERYPNWSPYNYTMDNPIRFIDPDGKGVDDWFKNESTGEIVWFDSNEESFESGGDKWQNLGEGGFSIIDSDGTQTNYHDDGSFDNNSTGPTLEGPTVLGLSPLPIIKALSRLHISEAM